MYAICNLEKNDRITVAIKWMLVATNIAFFVYYIALAFYYRPHYDDLHFMWKLQELSIFDYITDMYFSRSGRFGGYFLNGVVFSIINAIGISWLFPLLFIVIGISISCYVASDWFPNADKCRLYNFVIFFYFLYILTNIDFAVVYWLCAMGYYLKFPIALLTFSLINKQKLVIWQWIVLLLSVFTIGAGNEAFSPLFLVFLFINGMYRLHLNHYDFRKTFTDMRVKKICIAAAIIIVLLLIVVVAPGNYARLADTTEFHRPDNIVSWITGLVQAIVTYHYFLVFYVPYYLVLIALSCLIGINAKQNSWLDKTTFIAKKRKILLGILFLYVVYIFCTVLSSVFLFGDFGIQRNYTHTVYMTMLVLCLLGFLIGYWNVNVKKIVSILSIIGLSAFFSIMICNIIMDIPTARKYAYAVDERVDVCNEIQKRTHAEIVDVEPLPVPSTIDTKYVIYCLIGDKNIKPMLYYISDTKETPNEYAHHMKRLYNWDFDIVLSEFK